MDTFNSFILFFLGQNALHTLGCFQIKYKLNALAFLCYVLGLGSYYGTYAMNCEGQIWE